MPPLGRNYEAPLLTPEERALKDVLHNKGRTVQLLMKKLLPDKGLFGPYRTKAVEYQPKVPFAVDTKAQVWLERDKRQGSGPIRLMRTILSTAKREGAADEPIQTIATMDGDGHIIDEKYHELFPAQRLDLLSAVHDLVKLIDEAAITPEPINQLGRTAMNG